MWFETIGITFRYSPRVLEYAAQQLEAILPTTDSVNIFFDINWNAKDHHRYGHLYRGIDEVLARYRQSSLKNVHLHESISFLLFPRLYRTGALRVLPGTWLPKYVKATSFRTRIQSRANHPQRTYTVTYTF